MAFSQYLATEILEWIKGVSFSSALTTVYVSIHSGDPGVAGTSNNVTATVTGSANRIAVTTSTLSTIGAASGGGFQITNNNVVQITASAVNSTTQSVSHFGIWDAVTAGNFLASGALNSAVDVVNGDAVQFNVGAMAIRVV